MPVCVDGFTIVNFSYRTDENFNMPTTAQIPATVELAAITDNFTDISYETFRRKVDTEQFDMLCSGLGYAVGNEKGLHIKNDWSVSFRKALYKETYISSVGFH